MPGDWIQGLDPLRTSYVTSRVTGAGNYFGDVQGVGARKNTGVDSRLRDGGRAYKQTGDCRENGAPVRVVPSLPLQQCWGFYQKECDRRTGLGPNCYCHGRPE